MRLASLQKWTSFNEASATLQSLTAVDTQAVWLQYGTKHCNIVISPNTIEDENFCSNRVNQLSKLTPDYILGDKMHHGKSGYCALNTPLLSRGQSLVN